MLMTIPVRVVSSEQGDTIGKEKEGTERAQTILLPLPHLFLKTKKLGSLKFLSSFIAIQGILLIPLPPLTTIQYPAWTNHSFPKRREKKYSMYFNKWYLILCI